MIRNPFGSLFTCTSKRWATNLGGGSTTNGRDSAGKRLGIKLGNGSKCKLGQIIVRQRGFQYYPGENIGIGRDHTFWAKCDGVVKFTRDFWNKKTFVSVVGDKIPKFGPVLHEFHIAKSLNQ